MKYLYLLIGVLMIGLVSAYVAPSADNVILTFDETTYFTPANVDNVILTLDVSVPPTDTCTYTSGIWEVDCNDNCTITSNTDTGSDSIIVSGVGSFTINANITTSLFAYTPGCQILNIPNDGKELRIKGGG